ncbi:MULTISPECIES: GtrA family protein [unclassified Janthinobacterium]|uniref:GtrA family protein n=1 Tax=unclassified Janthinobacterium TaxID=2610881 RepID=UPI0016182875|nr:MULTISPECIES: GtrA family protein [unclassified Janthinobacterium]MBB5609086.1 putative flippase GtrA [Janthinobacterium sp. S3T4]MBB5614183.1 putative flippase GtrA [Janthinobacterium sp. S3M3]
MKQFLRFCLVGTLGFVVDAGVLQLLLLTVTTNPYTARIFSFLAAASVTWICNRSFTFRSAIPASRAEWLRYVGLMALGALVNYTVYALCIAASSYARAQPWSAVAAGSVAALGINFLLSRLLLRPAPASR